MELALIRCAVSPGGSLTVVGDERQQTDPTAYFRGWQPLIEELGIGAAPDVVLSRSYRCPAGVSGFARQVLEPTEPRAALDESVAMSQFGDQDDLALALARELAALARQDGNARVAVIFRRPVDAEHWRQRIRRSTRRKLHLLPSPEPGPHITVTSLEQVRGLEFDYVILPDVDASRYPDSAESRRALYLASTRALHGLWVAWTGVGSPIVQAN